MLPALRRPAAKWGYARERTLRALGAATVTVRPRCHDCATTHVLLPTELAPRRADTTEVTRLIRCRQQLMAP